ncbi:hypothetical protein ACH42_11415 [Endozoicomonas sp. (ex Bugula neritina AB1)]|nr:hypothetical protein ACH42_11415 [Endozoicomonas sp. (ex Bugula neritina AB1)]
MKRLYFLANTLDSVRKISDDLHRLGIDDWHLHVLSRNEAGLYHRQIHSTHFFQQSDLLHSGELGGIIGGVIGVAIVMGLELLPAFNPPLPLLILIAGIFTLFGVWCGGLVGVTRENYKTSRFHNELENGKHLIMVDASKQQEQEVRQRIELYHSGVTLAGEDSPFTLPLTQSFWSIPRHN